MTSTLTRCNLQNLRDIHFLTASDIIQANVKVMSFGSSQYFLRVLAKQVIYLPYFTYFTYFILLTCTILCQDALIQVKKSNRTCYW